MWVSEYSVNYIDYTSFFYYTYFTNDCIEVEYERPTNLEDCFDSILEKDKKVFL